MDPLLPGFVAAAFGILLVGVLSRRLGQPHVVGYLAAGILLGPHGLEVFTDVTSLTRVGEVGVILLLFFVGMEVDVTRLVAGWRISVLGTLLQIAIGTACVALIGAFLDWAVARIVLIGFALSLSSTALVISMLRGRKEMSTDAGRDAVGVLLAQDVALIPMLITIGLLAGESPPARQVVFQVLGGVAFVLLLLRLARGRRVRLPFAAPLRADRELQVFGAFLICFGLSVLSGQLGLSTALGAFAAGMIVAAARETDWLHRSLEPFRVLFVAAFFVSVGALIDVRAVAEEWVALSVLILAALATKTVINAGILRWLGRPWGTSLYVGALLSQVGEFSFVLAAVGRQAGLIDERGHQGAIGLIAGTLVLTPLWIRVLRPLRGEVIRAQSGT